jgi:pimeloyl-ACP methyl ester carboxylesterase
MKKQIGKVILVLSLLLIAAVSEPGAAAEGAPAEIVPSPCLVNVPDSRNVECGYLIVPADKTDPASPMLQLPYILMHSRSPNPAPDPIVFTTGGPGYSSLDAIWGFVNSPMSDDRDMIIFEQRGNLHAQPSLLCDESLWRDEGSGNTPCLDSLKEKNINFSDYTTARLAADIVDLRKALGYEQWNLYGTSYSTSLMQHVMEMDPAGVRSVVLQSVAIPFESKYNHQANIALRSLDLLFDDCQANPACAEAFPDLEDQFYRLIQQLNEEPIEVTVRSSKTDEKIPITVDGDLFISWIMVDSFYNPSFLPAKTPYLPLLVTELVKGNDQPLTAWVQEYWSSMAENQHWALGLMIVIDCQEAFPRAGEPSPTNDTEASRKLDGYQRWASSREICEAWDLPPAQDTMTNLISADTPTLILAGSYDPVTPPEWGKRLAEALPNSTYYEFASAGHDVTINNPCAQQLQTDFFSNPDKALDDSCLANVTDPTFVLPSDVYIAPGIYYSGNDVSLGDPRGLPWLEAVTAASIVAMGASLLALVIVGLVWLARQRKHRKPVDYSARLAYFLAVALIIIAFAIPILVTKASNYYLNGDWLIRTFGLSRDFLPSTLLALAIPLLVVLFLILAALVIWAWIKKRWSLPLRGIVSIVVVATLAILYLAFRWDLYTMLI